MFEIENKEGDSMLLEKTGKLDLTKLGEKLKLWFVERDWDVQSEPGVNTYTIKARKVDTLREIFGACRALVVTCYYEGNTTKVKIGQGSWTENILSNAGWLIATGGANLAFTFWSFEVEREFTSYAHDVLDNFYAFT